MARQSSGKEFRAGVILRLIIWLGLGGVGLLAMTVAAEWRQAVPGYSLSLPRDHASHPDYKIEWWYYTGNLLAADGRRFGYQLTFFRFGMQVQPKNPSRWAVRDLYMAHLAVTDVAGGRHEYAERINRAGIGWAGASTDGYRVWNEDWEVTLDEAQRHQLRAHDRGIGLDLSLAQGKIPITHGRHGLSQKGGQPGNASYYYSLTRMPTSGHLTINGEKIAVTGLSWMDHEFGTSFLEAEQIGWDWFSVQLDDGTDLMLFQLRRADGNRDEHSSGTLIDPSGRSTSINAASFTLVPGRRWRSATSGANYPIEWQVVVPGEGLDLSVRAVIEDQELHTTESTGVTYWEGAVDVVGSYRGRPVRGRGYLEMTGYAGASLGQVIGGH